MFTQGIYSKKVNGNAGKTIKIHSAQLLHITAANQWRFQLSFELI